eukprot:scaffold52161_cov33-Tisochrysis_lutea.AAC.1
MMLFILFRPECCALTWHAPMTSANDTVHAISEAPVQRRPRMRHRHSSVRPPLAERETNAVERQLSRPLPEASGYAATSSLTIVMQGELGQQRLGPLRDGDMHIWVWRETAVAPRGGLNTASPMIALA